MTDILKDLYKKIDNGEDVKSKVEIKIEQKSVESKPYISKKAYYRYVKFCYGTQGTRDEIVPLTEWKHFDKYSDEEMNEWNIKFPRESWYELRIETKIE